MEHYPTIEKCLKLIGARLQYFRQQQGIKQESVARQLHVSRSCISKIENGRENVHLATIIEFCQVINVSIITILSGVIM